MEKTKKGIVLFVSRSPVAPQAADKIPALYDAGCDKKISLANEKKTKEFTPISTKVAGAGGFEKSKPAKNNPQIFTTRHFIMYALHG